MKKPALYAVLIIFVLISMPLRNSSGEEITSGGEQPAPAVPAENIPSAVPAVQEPERDPFAVPFDGRQMAGQTDSEMPVAVDLKFEGVGIGPGDAFAVLNGDVYYEGEEKNRIKVVKVRKQEVELLVDGMPRTMKVAPEEEIKRLRNRKEQKTKRAGTPAQAPA